jgi:hypothetical protein
MITAFIPNESLNFLDGTTLCKSSGFCCGKDNTSCCENGDQSPIVVYGNSDALPSDTAELSSYYSGLHVSTASISRRQSTESTESLFTISKTTSASAIMSTFSAYSSSAPTQFQVNSPIPSAAGSTSTPALPQANTGLSSTAKVGIGLGASLGFVLLILVLLGVQFLYRRGVRKGREQGWGKGHEESLRRAHADSINAYSLRRDGWAVQEQKSELASTVAVATVQREEPSSTGAVCASELDGRPVNSTHR